MMDHDSAAKQQFAERYLLGELASNEREEFEEHYFDCAICAREVKDATTLVANARSIFAEAAPEVISSRPPRASRSFGQWLRFPVFAPAMATVILGLIVGYQNLVTIPGLREFAEPQLLSSVALRPVARGEDQAISVRPGDRFLHLVVDVSTSQAFSQYECGFQRNGSPVLTLRAPVPEPGGSLDLLLPASRFPAGSYNLVLRGMPKAQGPAVEVDRFSFVIRSE